MMTKSLSALTSQYGERKFQVKHGDTPLQFAVVLLECMLVALVALLIVVGLIQTYWHSLTPNDRFASALMDMGRGGPIII